MKAIDSFEILAFGVYPEHVLKRMRPGQIVLNANPSIREPLSELKSKDIANIRLDLSAFESPEFAMKREISELKLKHDLSIKGRR